MFPRFYLSHMTLPLGMCLRTVLTRHEGAQRRAEIRTHTSQRTRCMGHPGLIKHGNIDIKEGTPLKAFVAEDVALLPVH